MKNSYQINEEVWIHINGPNLVKGKVVATINFEETYYVIEIPCYIEKFYEIRNFLQISQTPEGPIALYQDVDLNEASGFMRRVGIALPNSDQTKEEKSTKPHKKHFRYSRKRK